MEWLAIGLPHNSGHLFARLPFGDAVQLAALVGTGWMTWLEVNLALDAKIKLTIAQLRGGRRPPPDSYVAWEQARRAGEDEIWARYHAKCDAVFADDVAAGEPDSGSTALLRSRERMLSRPRDERDHALAALNSQLGLQSVRPSSTSERNLTAIERDALHKLDASGFVGSHSMTEAVHDLAMPLVGSIERSA